MSRTAPVVETERLLIRHLDDADAGFIVSLLNDPAFLRNIGDRGVRTPDDARTYIANGPAASYARHGFGLFAVTLSSSGEPIGICGLVKREALDDVDLGFAFLPQFRGQGYALESAAAVKEYGRAVIKLRRLVAIALPSNTPSIRLLEKLGFRFERRLRLTPEGEKLALLAVAL